MHRNRDTNVKAIMTVIGGFNSNQLLPYIDWQLIKKNPKPFVGYSDITVLHNAIFAHTGLVTYLGPAYSTFGQKLHFDFTMEYFKKCLMNDSQFNIGISDTWSDDAWYLDQDSRKLFKNPGPDVIHAGKATGVLVGGNLGSLSLLFGTKHMPKLTESILCVEDDDEDDYKTNDRHFESLLEQPGADSIRAILLGRFQVKSEMNKERIRRMINLRPQLADIPVISGLDFGHTSPLLTLPIGGTVTVDTSSKSLITVDMF